MSVNYAEPHVKDPLYESAMSLLQKGDWQNGLVQLDKLILQYPLDHKLRTLRQEMHLRARMDLDEQEDQSVERRRRFTRLASRFWVVILVVVLAVAGYRSIASFIQEKGESARQILENEFMVVEQSAKFRDAEALLKAERPEDALVLLEEIAASGVDFPQLEDKISEAKTASALLADYNEGIRQMERQNWQTAQNLFEGILDKDPNFRDVSILQADVERLTFMDEILTTSNLHFSAEEWEAAVEGYETIRALDPEFQSQLIEEKLFSSYVNAAKSTLVDQADSLQALETAEAYFRKALALRPQDPDVKSERELAYLYLKAQNDFSEGLWSEVISGLEIINAENPNYALGTARQTLYEAYIARGDAWMTKGEYEAATLDYQRGSVLAKQDPEAILRLYEAHLKIAEVEGAQGNFENAVFQYRTAIDISDLKTRALRDNSSQASLLLEAEKTAEDGNFGLAYEQYRRALGIEVGNICLSFGLYQEALSFSYGRERMVTHEVQSGEYLNMLANRYRSTVCAIVVANELENPDVIYEGQVLQIPVLP